MGFRGPGIGFQEFSAWAPVVIPPWSESQEGLRPGPPAAQR